MKEGILQTHLDFHNHQIDLHGFNNKALAISLHSQTKRFEAATRLFKNDNHFSLLDLGAGLCDFYSYLTNHGFQFKSYTAVDINPKFVKRASELYPEVDFIEGSVNEVIKIGKDYDYLVASGIYNLGKDVTSNTDFIIQQLTALYPFIKKGFAANFLSSWAEKKDEVSIYYDPVMMLNIFREKFGNKIMLCHDYLPHDFTIIVFK